MGWQEATMKTGKFRSKRLLRSAVLSLIVVALVFATSGTAFGKTPVPAKHLLRKVRLQITLCKWEALNESNA